MRKLSHHINQGLRVLMLALALSASATQAQTPDEHAAHHPGGGSGTASGGGMSGMATPAPANSSGAMAMPTPAKSNGKTGAMPMNGSTPAGGMGGGGMMQGMQKMMEGMGGGAQKELYPSLMDLPPMPKGKQIEAEKMAHARMQTGRTQMSAALAKLSDAISKNDYDAMQTASLQVRQAQSVYDSGLAAHRALATGKAPRNVALDWFQRDMNLLPPMDADSSHNEMGMPSRWFHYLTIAFLSSIVVAMIGMYFLKMRRAAALFGRIEAGKGTPPPGSAPELAGGKPPPDDKPSGDNPPDGKPLPDDNPPDDNPPDDKSPSGGKPAAPVDKLDAPAVKPAAIPPAVLEATSASPVTANWRGQLRVGSIVTETPSVKTFRLLPSSGERFLPFTFVPGQFLNVAFSIGGARMNRSYSISSSPTQREYVDLTVRREPRGAVSRHIVDLLKVGDSIEAGGPVGKFTFSGTEADSIVLISAGVGITPMVSITRYLTEYSWPGEIFFIFTCRTPADFILRDEIAALERRNPKLHVGITMTRPEGTDWKGPRGRITKEWLTQTVPDLVSRRIHICGPVPMMDATKALLSEIGVPSEQVKTEAFGTPKPAPSAAGTTAKPTTPATGPLVMFSKNNKSAKIRDDQTILELSEELDIAIEFSCRVGTCGVCKIKMTSGEVEQEVQDALDDDDKAKGIILACQAKPTGAVTVEA